MRRNGAAGGAGDGRTRARRTGRRLVRTMVGALVVAGVLVRPVDVQAPAAAQPAAATLTVSPADGLTDGATVRVAETGLTGWPVLGQCGADPAAYADCDWTTVTPLEPGAGGTFEVDHRVFALIHTEAART